MVKYILLILTILLFSCKTSNLSQYSVEIVSVKDTITLPYAHRHFLFSDGYTYCYEYPADTFVFENFFVIPCKSKKH